MLDVASAMGAMNIKGIVFREQRGSSLKGQLLPATSGSVGMTLLEVNLGRCAQASNGAKMARRKTWIVKR